MSEDLSVLYDQDFIDSLPAFSPEGNSHVVALLKHPDNKFACAREQLEAWYLELPAKWRSHYYKWLRSTDDSKFLAAVWELYVHHLLQSEMPVDVVCREERVGQGDDETRIDFTVRHDGCAVLCEVYALQEGKLDAEEARYRYVFRQALESCLPSGYVFDALVRYRLKDEDTAQSLANRLCEKVARVAGRGGQLTEGQQVLWSDSTGWASVIPHRCAVSGPARLRGVGFGEDTHRIKEEVRRRVIDKASEKTNRGTAVDEPFVLFAADCYRPTWEPSWYDACYGTGTYNVSQARISKNGLFGAAGAEEPSIEYVSGLVCTYLLLGSAGWEMEPVAYLNPCALRPVEPEMFRHAIPVWAPSGWGTMVRLEPEEAG